jgi:putative ABC transport system permease protein
LKQDNIELIRKNSTEHVVLPYRLILNEGFVVSDDLFKKLVPVKTEKFTGFFINEFEKTTGMGGNLVVDRVSLQSEDKPYAMTVSGTLLEKQMSMYSMMLFVALLIGAIFFIAAGSSLYFRLYSDMDYDERQYMTIMRVGLSDQELNKIVTRQLILLFFVPIIVAIIHSTFAFITLQSMFTLSIESEMIVVLACFATAQLIYFFFIRHHYLRKLKNASI